MNAESWVVPDAVANQGADARGRFIAKTYAHLVGAIFAFTGIEIFFFMSGMADSMARVMLGSRYGWLLVLGGFMVVSWIATHIAHNTRNIAAQYAALLAYVVGEALIFVPLLWIANRVAGDNSLIASAAIVTFFGFSGLSVVAFATRKDFSFLKGILMWGFVAALLLIVASIIFGFNLGMFFSVVMVVFAGAAILYDTSNIIHHYPEECYVGAALSLFASVALLFWYVLRIFIAARD